MKYFILFLDSIFSYYYSVFYKGQQKGLASNNNYHKVVFELDRTTNQYLFKFGASAEVCQAENLYPERPPDRY